jgi:hypothetical protein
MAGRSRLWDAIGGRIRSAMACLTWLRGEDAIQFVRYILYTNCGSGIKGMFKYILWCKHHPFEVLHSTASIASEW